MNSPENSDENPSPPRRERTGMDPEERSLWDLDEGDELLDELGDLDEDDSVFSDRQASETPETGEREGPVGDVLDVDLKDEETALSGEEAPEPAAEKKGDEEVVEEKPEPATRKKAGAEGAEAKPASSKLEKISLTLFLVLILGGVIGVFLLFFREIPTTDPEVSADFPVEGKNVVIEDIATYWRAPDLEKDSGVRSTTVAIPAGTILLGEGKGAGALRVFFEDDEGDLVGDPVTTAFSNGTFAPGKTDSLEIHGTEGFSDLGDLPAYLTGQIDSWFLIVKEGPSADARGNQFKEILRMRIDPVRR